jgi:hypothetical protein
MKKLFLLVCVILLVSCVAKKPVVKTEGLEEVVVFGEDTSNISEEAVLPTPTEPTVATLPLEEIAPPAAAITPPPITGEVTLPPAPVEEVVVPPPVTEIVPPVEEVIPPPPAVVSAPPLEEVSLAAPPVPPVLEEGGPMTTMTPPHPSHATAPSQIFGFRVQIFASSTEKNANRVADDARSPFGGKVYIEHAAPYYKVRVGDCLTAEEAQVIKSKAVNLGFKGAFVVETMINP